MLSGLVQRFFSSPPFELRVADQDFKLRLMSPGDFESWAYVRAMNREVLQPFEPVWAEDALDRASYMSQVKTARHEFESAMGGMMLLIHLETGEVIGGINLRNVRRGAAQMGTVGYWIAAQFGGVGRMTAAVGRMVQFGFEDVGLNRVEACCVPENHASANILLRNGFVEEGYAQKYLKINGQWRDHRLFAIVSPESED